MRCGKQVLLCQPARALGELLAQVAGRIRETVRANPRDKLQPSQEHEGGDLRRVLV